MCDSDSEDYFVCPNCGAELRSDATFCRHCGASDDAGWGGDEDSHNAEGYGEWEDDPTFDYDEFVAREFPDHASPKPRRRSSQSIVVAVVVLLCIGLLLLGLIW